MARDSSMMPGGGSRAPAVAGAQRIEAGGVAVGPVPDQFGAEVGIGTVDAGNERGDLIDHTEVHPVGERTAPA